MEGFIDSCDVLGCYSGTVDLNRPALMWPFERQFPDSSIWDIKELSPDRQLSDEGMCCESEGLDKGYWNDFWLSERANVTDGVSIIPSTSPRRPQAGMPDGSSMLGDAIDLDC